MIFIPLLLLVFVSCSENTPKPVFEDDVTLLHKLGNMVILKNEQALLALCPEAQAQVFAVSADGWQGTTLNYFNRQRISETEAPYPLSGMGGASRLMMGPQFGPYSVFFDPGKEQIDQNIQISPALDEPSFTLVEQTQTMLKAEGKMIIRNANAYEFETFVQRKVQLMSREMIQKALGLTFMPQGAHVCFNVSTTLQNVGKEQWTRENGLLSLWDLSCMLPADDNIVVIPLSQRNAPVMTYFTPVDDRRLQVKGAYAFYRGDAAYMNKIGLLPEYLEPVFGSYSESLGQLVIGQYQLAKNGTYLNNAKSPVNPYKGAAIDVFNGEINPELKRNWPFYEMETSSSTAELKPGEKLRHSHSIFIFTGDTNELNKIANEVLGLSLDEIMASFQ